MIDLWEFVEFGAKQVGDASVGPPNLIYCNYLKSILSSEIVGKAEILLSSGSQKLLVVILVWGRLNYWF